MNNMNFDVIVSNPPYNDVNSKQDSIGLKQRKGSNLAKNFLDTLQSNLNHRGILQLVLPVSRVLTESTTSRVSKLGRLDIDDATNYFPEIKLGKIAYITLNKCYSSSINNRLEVYKKEEDSLAKLFIQTTVIDSKIGYSRSTLEEKLQDSGLYEVWVSPSCIKYTNSYNLIESIKDKSKGYWRVVIPNLGNSLKDIGKIKIASPDITLFGNCKAFKVGNHDEAVQLANYLNSDNVKQKIARVKTSISNSKKFFEYVKMPVFN